VNFYIIRLATTAILVMPTPSILTDIHIVFHAIQQQEETI